MTKRAKRKRHVHEQTVMGYDPNRNLLFYWCRICGAIGSGTGERIRWRRPEGGE